MIIRQAAFENSEKMLKGGLHCHTTRSDGAGAPDEVIRLHVKNGYDFLALTDHRYYNYQNFAPETDITIVPGMEFDSTFEDGWAPEQYGFRCFHTVCIGPDNETNGFKQDEKYDSGISKNQEEYQPYLDWIHKNNNLTIYCHPEWSSTPARYFDKMKGNFAMEIWNSGCAISCDMDTNAAYWDELLGQGQKIYGVATDDGHGMHAHCNGWVMVNSENKVPAILDALKDGKFYSSCGPVIKDFYVEDGVVHVECEGASCIQFISDKHPTTQIKGENLTHGEMKMRNKYHYIRVSVIDADGKRAWTNPIFLD